MTEFRKLRMGRVGGWVVTLGVLASWGMTEVIDIGSRRELFVDHTMVESMDGVELRMHEPQSEGVTLEFDQAWEGKFSAYATVINDDGLFKMYYRGLPSAAPGTEAVVCYAQSRDGVFWFKPNLNSSAVVGSEMNNVIWGVAPEYSRNFSPFIDKRPGTPSNERFKAIAGVETKGLVAFVSTDGIRWQRWKEGYIFTKGMFDSHNVVFWSHHEGVYVCYFRTWTGEGFTGFRTISRTTSPDLVNWSDPVAMDFGDTPMEQLYTNGTQPYFRAPHIYIGLAKRFFPGKAALSEETVQELVKDPKRGFDASDAVFMSSRGGNHYDRTFMEAFIRPGDTAADWASRDNTPALGMLPAPDGRNLYIYRMSHYAQETAHMSRYRLRLDGFVSVQAPYGGGELVTKPFRFKGETLEINYASSAAGELRVELQDEHGDAIDGFAAEDCALIFGDEIARTVQWTGGKPLSDLVGQVVRMRIVMKDADFYSFRFR